MFRCFHRGIESINCVYVKEEVFHQSDKFNGTSSFVFCRISRFCLNTNLKLHYAEKHFTEELNTDLTFKNDASPQ